MNAHRNYHDNSGFTQCSNLTPCFFLFQLIVRASSRKKRSQTTRLSDKEPPPSTTSRPPPQPLRNAITLNTLLSAVRKCAALRETEVYNARIPCSFPVRLLVRHTRSKNVPHRRAPARTSKPGWREKHQYQQQQIYLVSCLLWKRVTTTAEVYAFRSACQCSCHRGTISSLRDRDANNQIHQHTAIS